MEFSGERSIPATQERIWDLISDPEVLASSIPGVTDVERVSETEYEAIIEKTVLKFSVELEAEIELVELNPPDEIVAEAHGTDTKADSRFLPSRGMNATMTLGMTAVDETETVVEYVVDMEFYGPQADMAAKAISGKIESDIDEFFDNVTERTAE